MIFVMKEGFTVIDRLAIPSEFEAVGQVEMFTDLINNVCVSLPHIFLGQLSAGSHVNGNVSLARIDAKNKLLKNKRKMSHAHHRLYQSFLQLQH